MSKEKRKGDFLGQNLVGSGSGSGYSGKSDPGPVFLEGWIRLFLKVESGYRSKVNDSILC